MSAAAIRILVGVVLVANGCAPALREPPSVDELTGRTERSRPEQVDDLLKQAENWYSRRTERAVRRAAELWLEAAAADRTRTEGWVGAARALVWLADHLAEAEWRKEAATSAVHAAQWCNRVSLDDAGCLYWLAVAVGIQARERRATALDAMPRMVELLDRALRIQPTLEQAGPHRVLALVYLRAPGWPTGPGDRDLGLAHARKAVELRPDFPPNQLALAEALAATDDREGSREVYLQALELARKRAADGDPDAHEWVQEAEEALASRRGR